MQAVRRRLTYANVVATLALFLALSGGVVYAATTLGRNTVKSKNIAAHAVKSRNLAKGAVKAKNLAANAVTEKGLAKNAVTAAKVKAGTLTRAQLAAGTLPGLQVAEVQATSIPGLASEAPSGGTPVPLTGTTSFTPAPGKSYELLTELAGNPSDADGTGPGSCYASVDIALNGHLRGFASIYADAASSPPFNVEPIGGNVSPVGLLEAGVTQSISAVSFGTTGCAAGTTGSLRAVIVELG